MTRTENTKTKTGNTSAGAENTRIRIILTIILGFAAVAAFSFALGRIQYTSVLNTTRKEMKENAGYITDSYPDARVPYNLMESSVDDIYIQDLFLMATWVRDDSSFEVSDEYLTELNKTFAFFDLMIADRDGHIIAAASRRRGKLDQVVRDALAEAFKDNNYCIVRPENDNMPADETADDVYARSNLTTYAFPYDSTHAFVIEDTTGLHSGELRNENAWASLLENETIGRQGYAFVWSQETGKLLFFPDDELTGVGVESLGLNMNKIGDRKFSWHTVNGVRTYLYTVWFEDEGVWIACAVSSDELELSRRFNHAVLCIIFALITSAMVYYVILLLLQKKVKVMSDFSGSGKAAKHRTREYKLVIFTILMIVVMFFFVFYLQTLYLMSSWAEAASGHTARIEKTVSEQDAAARQYVEIYSSRKKAEIETLAGVLAKNPDMCTTTNLDVFSYIIEAPDVRILDKEGVTHVETSAMAFPDYIGEEEAIQESTRYQEEETLTETANISEWMSNGREITESMTSEDDTVSGYLYVRYYSSDVDSALRSYSLSELLDRIKPGRNGFVFAVDTETKRFVYYPDDSMEGLDSLEYGLTEAQIKDNYCDYITIDGVTYYAATDRIDRNLFYYVVPRSELLGERFVVCGLVTLAVTLLLFMIGVTLYTSREQVEVIKPDSAKHISVDEGRNSPEYRVMKMLLYYGVGIAAVLAAYSSFRINTGTGNVLGYVLAQKWERGLNVFALSAAILILSQGGLILFFLSKLISLVADILPIRGGTILKMLGSLVTYLAMAFIAYRCMICFGLNPTALMASAGIVSVIIGIGANSLVGDILAGIFILMEGNIQVGDVIKVGDFRGYVMELGIRMTKVFDMDTDDVKIIPNNEVRNVVHMTMRNAIVYSEFQIRYEEKLEAVEEILREELKNVKDKSPLILNGPAYIGVSKLDESGVVLKTATRCHEACRLKVEREVNHIVYTIFQKNNISVPYPQVTVHQGDDRTVER